MIFRLIAMIMVTTTIAVALCVVTHVSNVRVIAESEHALAGTCVNISDLLRQKYNDQWEYLDLAMRAQYGPEWTNRLSGERVSRLMQVARKTEASEDPLAE